MIFDDYFDDLLRLVKEALSQLGASPTEIPALADEAMDNLHIAYCLQGHVFGMRPKLLAKSAARHVRSKFWRIEAKAYKGIQSYLNFLVGNSGAEVAIANKDREKEFNVILSRFINLAKPLAGAAVLLWFDGESYADISSKLGVSSDFGRKALFSFVEFLYRQRKTHIIL